MKMPQQTNHNWLIYLPGALALAALGFLFLIYLIYAGALLRFPFDYDQGEGFELWSAVMVLRGQLPYTDNAAFPFHSSLYGPVFPLLMAPFTALFGPALWYGRLWSFLTTLVMGSCIYYLVHKETGERLPALLGAGLFFASNTVYQIGPLFRQHTTMEMFGLLAVVLIVHFEQKSRPHLWIAGSMLCLLLASYTKPLTFDVLAAVFGYLFLRRPAWSVLYGVGFGLAVGAVFGLMQVLTGGHWATNILSANANPFIDGQITLFYTQWFRLHAVIILVAAAYSLYSLYFDRISIYALLFIFGALKGLASGKWGAGPSYFMMSIIAACICAGLAFGLSLRTLKKAQPARRADLLAWRVIVPLLVIIQAGLNWHMPLNLPFTRPLAGVLGIAPEAPWRFRADYFDTVGYTQLGHLPHAEDIAAGWRIVEYARAAPGPAWSEEAMFPIYAGKAEVVGNPALLFNLGNSGLLDTSQMIAMIEARQFGVVIFRAQFYPTDVLQAIGQNYETVEVIPMNGFEYIIMLPR